jgi:YD repeat-containing protein
MLKPKPRRRAVDKKYEAHDREDRGGRSLCHRDDQGGVARPTVLTTLMSAILAVVAIADSTTNAAFADQILEIYADSLTTYLESSTTNVQDVRPLVDQRGVNIDGSMRKGAALPMALAGNPFRGDGGWNGNKSLNGIQLDIGTYSITDVDIALPAEGFSWVIGRSYNCRQEFDSSHYDSDGYQGNNWFQLSQPEILLYEGATDDEDLVYLVYGADRFVEFKREDTDSDVFKGKNGAAGAFHYEEGDVDEPDTYTYYDQNGNRVVFFGFDGDASPCEGQIWKMIDTAGNTAYVGDSSTGSTAISSGFNGSGQITTAYDPSGRRFSYTYTSGNLTEVKAEVDDSGWVEVAKVEYAYYGNETYGDTGDLKTVTITTPLSDTVNNIEDVRTKYYRYWEGTYNSETNPGNPHQLQYIYDFEGVRAYDWAGDSTFDDDHLTGSEGSLEPYAAAYFEYDSSYRVREAWFNGACGCAGGSGNGIHTFEYETNGSFSNTSGYDTAWYARTTVQLPSTYDEYDGEHEPEEITSWLVQYFDETGQPLHKVRTDNDPDNTSPAPDFWAYEVTRDSSGCVTEIDTPANVTGYTHSTAAFTNESSTGLIRLMTRFSSGDMTGYVEHNKYQEGTSGDAFFDGTVTLTSRSLTVGSGGDTVGVTRPLVSGRRVYTQAITSGTTGSHETTFSYTWHSGTDTNVLYLAPETITTTYPIVTTANNGSNSATSTVQYIRQDGSTAFSKSATGEYTYTYYDDGQLKKVIRDCQTNHATDFASGDDPDTDFGISETGDGLRDVDEYEYDKQGRLIESIPTESSAPSGTVKTKPFTYYTRLGDRRLVTLHYVHRDTSGPTTYYGPVSYSVTNHAGKTEFSGTIALSGNSTTTDVAGHIDTTDADPITAVDTGTVERMSVNVYDEAGTTVEESRAYFDIPASGAGTDGTNYDATTFAYNNAGRQWRVEDATGTVRRTVFDTLGRTVSTFIGTNDNGWTGGDSSGDVDLVKTSVTEYDGGYDNGNSLVTKTTVDEDGDWTGTTSDQRITEYSHDVKGRVLLVIGPQAPYSFMKYDNMGRTVAVGVFKDDASIDVSTDDPTTETTNRIGLSQTFYDEKGQVYKTQRHKIDDSDGSDDDNLQFLTWYDAAGRVIKEQGSQVTKTTYNRLGQVTHRFVLASHNDSSYSDADDVTGDIVLTESQTAYDPYDFKPRMSAVIERHHDDYGSGTETTGALDTNADADDLKFTAANIKGRIQISATWYDEETGRAEDTVAFGTYGGSDFDRDDVGFDSPPARSDTALRTTYTYNDEGTLQQVTDPKGIITRTVYDDMGRTTAVIRNYVNGAPSTPAATATDDLHTRYEYTDGLQTKVWVDVNADNYEDAGVDQVTEYTYGTTKGTSAGDSNISTGHLLQKVTYPDSTSGTDVVTYAYNALGQLMYTKDQAGNVIETDYDTAGREIHRRASTIVAGFDNTVQLISTAYGTDGRVSTVTQYDDDVVGSGSVIDQVKYTYDDWGNLETFEQDRDSAVTASTSPDDGYYDVVYTYAKATPTGGRRTIRRTGFTFPNSAASITYEYLSTNDLHDDEASRVTRVKVSTTAVASYAYNGTGSARGHGVPGHRRSVDPV